MADHHQGSALIQQIPLKPLDRFHVQVVGRFVQQQQIGILQQDLAQGDAHLPAPGIVANRPLSGLRRESDGRKKFVDARLEFIAMQRLETVLQLTQVLDQCVEVIGVTGGLLTSHLLLDLPLAVQDIGGFAEGLEQFLPDRAVQVHIEFLLQIGDAWIPLANNLPAAGFLLACDQA